MGIDDSYELRREEIFSERIGLSMNGEQFSDHASVYLELPQLEAYLQREAISEIDEAPDFALRPYAMGRSAGTMAVLLTVAGSAYIFLTQAKNLDDGFATIRKWARNIRALGKRFTRRHTPRFTVEALKILCLADLYDRYGGGTEPVAGLIRSNAASMQAPDRTWTGVDPVYIFIPDRRRYVTHLYAISSTGEIKHYQELPPLELQECKFELATATPEEPLQLKVPTQTVDPAVTAWQEMKQSMKEIDKTTEHDRDEKESTKTPNDS